MPVPDELADAQPSTPTLKVHRFSESFLEHRVHFQVVGLRGGFFLWVGTDPSLANLSCAIQSPFESRPSATSLFGVSDEGERLARKLSARSKKQVFVSLNLTSDERLLPLIEKRIIDEMTNNELCFGV